jgi:hypothetical protein
MQLKEETECVETPNHYCHMGFWIELSPAESRNIDHFRLGDSVIFELDKVKYQAGSLISCVSFITRSKEAALAIKELVNEGYQRFEKDLQAKMEQELVENRRLGLS